MMKKNRQVNDLKLGESGPSVLMLHGWGQSLDSLKPLGEHLSTRFQVHLIDLPGFGLTPAPASAWDSSQYADALIEYLDEKGLDSVHIIGHSFGGKVAMHLASRYPARVARLVLIASSGLKRRRSFLDHLRMMALRLAARLLKKIDHALGTELFRKKFASRFGSRDYNQAGKLKEILVKTVHEELSEVAKQIGAPTLLLWGENDTETPPEMARRLNNLIANSTAYIFPGKDHYQLFSDGGSHLSASHIIPFLSRHHG